MPLTHATPVQHLHSTYGKGAKAAADPGFTGAGEKSRTPDLRITNALLYQLSYAGVPRPSRTAEASRAF